MHECVDKCKCDDDKRLENREQHKDKKFGKKKKLKDKDLFEIPSKHKKNNSKAHKMDKKKQGKKKTKMMKKNMKKKSMY